MKTITTAYISLPITGYNLQERRTYALQAARVAGARIRKEHPEVEHVLIQNPLEICKNPNLPYGTLLGADIEALCQCDMIVLCEGWKDSRGCRIEKYTAEQIGIPTMELGTIQEDRP